MTKTLYIDGEKIGTVIDMDHTVDGEDAIVTSIPAGEDEVIVPITIENVDKFMEAYREVFPLSDAQIFKEWLAEGGEPSNQEFDNLNIYTLTLARVGEADYKYVMVSFKDGSIWLP